MRSEIIWKEYYNTIGCKGYYKQAKKITDTMMLKSVIKICV